MLKKKTISSSVFVNDTRFPGDVQNPAHMFYRFIQPEYRAHAWLLYIKRV